MARRETPHKRTTLKFATYYKTRIFSKKKADAGSAYAAIPLDMQRAGAPYVYVNLTEFNGKFDFVLRYNSLKSDAVIAAFAFQMESYDPLKTVQFARAFPSVPKVEDVIALELLCESEMIDSQRILVT